MSTEVVSTEIALWLRWKQAAEKVRAAVVAEVADATALSEPELTVLVHLDHAGGTLRQNALVAATGWDRSRLSHVLTRMEKGGLVERVRLRNGVELTTGAAGAAAIGEARAPLQRAVERHLTARLTGEQARVLADVLEVLGS